jgi:hypothetical protein
MTNDSENPDFAKARTEIVYDVLEKLKIMPR